MGSPALTAAEHAVRRRSNKLLHDALRRKALQDFGHSRTCCRARLHSKQPSLEPLKTAKCSARSSTGVVVLLLRRLLLVQRLRLLQRLISPEPPPVEAA